MRTAAAVGTGVALLFSLPFVLHMTSGVRPRIDTNAPLKPEAVRRGAFNNSGSKDLGPEYVLAYRCELSEVQIVGSLQVLTA
jgi:hypothetical protein